MEDEPDTEKMFGFVLNVKAKEKDLMFINVVYPDIRHRCPPWPYKTK